MIGRDDRQTTSLGFRETMATLDRLEALLAKVDPFVERFDERGTRDWLRSKIRRVRLDLDIARQNAHLAEGILPV